MIAVIDYGAGNLASVLNALKSLGYDAFILEHPNKLHKFSYAILPGVGSFKTGMDTLNQMSWIPYIKEYVSLGKPLLGICLGMQLLFEIGEEGGETLGLGLISGRVTKLKVPSGYRLPHVGWNNIEHSRQHLLFKGIREEIDFYFVHSYECCPEKIGDIIAYCNYGCQFVSGVARGNVVGIQFHPEKSQPAGLRLFNNFIKWNRS